ncbi:LacI family DNA-binding transcriptional regulator [Arthrobacter sp. 35W]|uniref:LacI family DNA-binding transcriptional regulator n=1 Tax=Arthrobacter sp. 35W TaxID=1132441 RepID=UPI000550BD70|nr:LacI family DNA-binding transcriptional regulator [Arthrobacter sp. 35W]
MPTRPEHRGRPQRGVTIEDVARGAGVSRQTVSNALNAPHRVRGETLERVKTVIEELGYRPDQSARSLKTGLRYTIGYQAPDDDPFNPNPVMGGFLTALCDAAAASGYRLLLFRPRPGASDPRAAYEDLIAARQVDGFILSDVLADDPRVDHLGGLGFPFVAFGQTGPGRPQDWVDVDNARGMHDVAALLAARGHRRVGYIESATNVPWFAQRYSGFTRGAAEHGLDVATVLEPRAAGAAGESRGGLTMAIQLLLRSPQRPSALVASADPLALAAYDAIRAEGLTVGADIAVVGFNDLPLSGLLAPQLASVRMPLPAIAQELVARLLAQVHGGEPAAAGSLLPPEVIIRGSIQPR